MGIVSWWRWIALPWRQPSLAVALVGALAIPVLLLSAGPMFRTAAADEITEQVVARLEPLPAGLIVQGQGVLDQERLGRLADELEGRLDRVPGLAPATRTLLSDETWLSSVDGVPMEAGPGPGEVRVMSRPGAVDAVELLDGRRDGGVLVPASLAELRGIAPGSTIGLGVGTVTVAGVYRDLWDGERDPFWDELPRDMVPRFLRVFDEPEFELVLGPDELVRPLELSGRARWEASLAEPPTTWDDFRALRREYRAVESALVREGPLNDAYLGWAGDPDVPAFVSTALYGAYDDAARLINELEQPVRTATWAGTVAGLALSTLGAVFLIRRRRGDYRLMAADGDAAWRFFGRAGAQYVAPAVAAVGVGVALGWLAVRVLGPSGTADVAVVPIGEVVVVTLIAVVLAATVSAAISVRLVDALEAPVGEVSPTWLLVVVGIAATMWVQVGRERSDDVNPLIVAFPFVGVVAGVLVTVAVLRILLRRFRRTGRSLPTPLFLAWRALTASETGAMFLTAALGLASGLVVLSVSFVETIDVATDVKAASTVGSVSRLDTTDNVRPGDLPEGSTLVLTSSTRVDGRLVEVLAIDPATFADAVVWPSQFGGTAAELVDLLGTETPGAVPAVVIAGQGLPTRGEFGVQRVWPYQVVGTLAASPMVSDVGSTLIVRADEFERLARARWDQGGGSVDPTEALAAEALGQELEYDSPLNGYGDTVLSTRPLDELVAIADEQSWRVTSAVSLDDQRADVSAQSTRWAFDYLGLLAAVGGAVALAVMAFYLADRRRQREVTAAMTDQMGIPHRTRVVAAVVEMVGLVVAAIAAGATAATVTARRVFPTFEPDPDVPPTVGLIVDVATITSVFLIAVASVALITIWSQRNVSRHQKAEVLRG